MAAGKSDDDAKIKAIAGPALLGTLADPLLSVVDTAWVSRLGTTALGAVAASSEIFTLVIAVSLALREAASSTIARLTAQGRWREAEAHGAKTLLTAFGVGALLMIMLLGPRRAGRRRLIGMPARKPPARRRADVRADPGARAAVRRRPIRRGGRLPRPGGHEATSEGGFISRAHERGPGSRPHVPMRLERGRRGRGDGDLAGVCLRIVVNRAQWQARQSRTLDD